MEKIHIQECNLTNFLFFYRINLKFLDTHIDAIKSFKIDFNDDFYQPKVFPYLSNVRKTSGCSSVSQTKKSVFPKKVGYVSFIESPSHFYVRTDAFVKTFHSLKDKCREEGNRSQSPENIELGEIYLIKELKVKANQKMDEYRRGRLEFKKNDMLYHVFYIDYGNYEEVSTDRIRKICSSDLAENTENIILCSLYDIEPIKDKWEDEAIYHMKDIINRFLKNIFMLTNFLFIMFFVFLAEIIFMWFSWATVITN